MLIHLSWVLFEVFSRISYSSLMNLKVWILCVWYLFHMDTLGLLWASLILTGVGEAPHTDWIRINLIIYPGCSPPLVNRIKMTSHPRESSYYLCTPFLNEVFVDRRWTDIWWFLVISFSLLAGRGLQLYCQFFKETLRRMLWIWSRNNEGNTYCWCI